MTIEELKNYLNRIPNTQKEVVVNGLSIEKENLQNNSKNLNINIEEKRYKRLINLLKL